MGGRTKADIDAIRSMGTGLKKVKKAFDGISSIDDKYGDAFGSGDLTDKIDEFASNWDISREELTAEVDALSKIATAAADAYDKIEDALEKALQSEKGNKGKGK